MVHFHLWCWCQLKVSPLRQHDLPILQHKHCTTTFTIQNNCTVFLTNICPVGHLRNNKSKKHTYSIINLNICQKIWSTGYWEPILNILIIIPISKSGISGMHFSQCTNLSIQNSIDAIGDHVSCVKDPV